MILLYDIYDADSRVRIVQNHLEALYLRAFFVPGGMKTKEAIKRVAQEMNGSKNELYDAYHKHI